MPQAGDVCRGGGSRGYPPKRGGAAEFRVANGAGLHLVLFMATTPTWDKY